MKKIVIISVLAFAMLSLNAQNKVNEIRMKQGKDIHLIFQLSDKVVMKPVQYTNRYGIVIAAHMYMPKDLDSTKKYPAIVIGPPFGGVKEQGPGVYAQGMAERGFVAIAFDQSYNGESSGQPRHIASWELFSEDYSAGVDFLGTRPFVDKEKIGAIGICGGGSFVLTAAQADPRIKAIATSSMYDFNMMRKMGTPEGLQKNLSSLSEQRWKDFEKGSPEIREGFPSEPTTSIPEGLDPIRSEFWEFYGMKRGHHPNASGSFTTTSSVALLNFPLMNYIETISPRPILCIVGENSHSRHFADDAFNRAKEPKELYVVPGARHIDLYDGGDKNYIPFDKLESFFKTNLK